MIQNRVVLWLARSPFYIGGAIAAAVAFAGGVPIFNQVMFWLKEGATPVVLPSATKSSHVCKLN